MPEYQKMYAILCAAASEAITLLKDIPPALPAKCALQAALYQAEDLYIDLPQPRYQEKGTDIFEFKLGGQ